MWCERASAAASNMTSTGVEGKWGRNSDNLGSAVSKSPLRVEEGDGAVEHDKLQGEASVNS